MDSFDIVCVVAGGWSAKFVDIAALPGLLIGVNDASRHMPRCDIAVSMDRLWTEHRWPFLMQRALPAHIRTSALKNIRERPRWLFPFENDNAGLKFSDDIRTLNGNNSGFCALNLAYTMRPKRVYLVGFDMNRSPQGVAYWYPPMEWAKPGGATSNGKYLSWLPPFEMAAKAFGERGIEVLNMSETSAIPSFKKVRPDHWRKEC